MRTAALLALAFVVGLVLLVGAFTLMTLTVPAARNLDRPPANNHIVLAPAVL